MNVRLEPSWKELLDDQFSLPYFQALTFAVKTAYQSQTVYPPARQIFNALDSLPLASVKVVILGQDPYHGPGQAMGLSFSVPDGVPLPPSLQNIYKEIQTDLQKSTPTSGDLTRWVNQGVLLLNSTLTVSAGNPGSHSNLGWQHFTDTIIGRLSEKNRHLVFLLWGNFARKKKSLIDSSKHLVLEAPHPSPLSAYQGFFGCKHFSKANQYLIAHSIDPIDW